VQASATTPLEQVDDLVGVERAAGHGRELPDLPEPAGRILEHSDRRRHRPETLRVNGFQHAQCVGERLEHQADPAVDPPQSLEQDPGGLGGDRHHGELGKTIQIGRRQESNRRYAGGPEQLDPQRGSLDRQREGISDRITQAECRRRTAGAVEVDGRVPGKETVVRRRGEADGARGEIGSDGDGSGRNPNAVTGHSHAGNDGGEGVQQGCSAGRLRGQCGHMPVRVMQEMHEGVGNERPAGLSDRQRAEQRRKQLGRTGRNGREFRCHCSDKCLRLGQDRLGFQFSGRQPGWRGQQGREVRAEGRALVQSELGGRFAAMQRNLDAGAQPAKFERKCTAARYDARPADQPPVRIGDREFENHARARCRDLAESQGDGAGDGDAMAAWRQEQVERHPQSRPGRLRQRICFGDPSLSSARQPGREHRGQRASHGGVFEYAEDGNGGQAGADGKLRPRRFEIGHERDPASSSHEAVDELPPKGEIGIVGLGRIRRRQQRAQQPHGIGRYSGSR
jgi:hypothetical protein